MAILVSEGMATMASVGEDFPIQQARVREILGYYKSLGMVGSFGAMNIAAALQDAEAALASGDVVRILKAYQALKDIRD